MENFLGQPLTPDDVGSRVLAPVIRPLMSASGVFWCLRTRLLDALCKLTLRMAREHVPYWKKHLPLSGSSGLGDSLESIPPINRSIIDEHRHEFISPLTHFSFCSMTSGTTSGQPLLVERSEQEQMYLYNLFMMMHEESKPDSCKPLGLSGVNIHHGDVLQLPGEGYTLTVNLHSDAGYAQAAWLLFRSFSWEGFEKQVSSITASYGCLYRLYLYLKERRLRLPRGQIRWLSAYGSPIPSPRRTEISEFFGSSVHDNWSMTEVFGGAAYCTHCDGYHMSPFAIDEVLPISCEESSYGYTQRLEPIDEGIGELTLTPLFPFTQRFVLIRYRTGDLVERVRTDGCAGGLYAFRPLGRIKNCVRLSDGTWLSTVRIAMRLDSMTGLRRPRTNLKCLDDSSAGEFPYFRLYAQPGALRAMLEVYPAELPSSKKALERLRYLVENAMKNYPVDVTMANEIPNETAGSWKL